MAIENLKSTKVTNFETSGPASVADGTLYGGGGFYRDQITTVQTTTSNGSTYKLMPMASNLIPEYITVRTGGSGDSPDTDLGLFHVTTGTTYDGCIATALDLDDTGDHVALNIGLGGTFKNVEAKTLWELAGLTRDPGGVFYFLLSLDADNVAAGTHEIVMKVINNQ
jgi:hypothetical protein